MRGWYRARRKARAVRKGEAALTRLHGRSAPASRRRGFGGGSGDGDGGDALGDLVGGLVEALFKFFD